MRSCHVFYSMCLHTTSNVPPRTVSINYHVRAIITNRRARTDRSCIKMIGKRRRMTVINKNLVHGGSPSHSFPLITINYGLSVGPGFVTGKSYEFSSWAWLAPPCVTLSIWCARLNRICRWTHGEKGTRESRKKERVEERKRRWWRIKESGWIRVRLSSKADFSKIVYRLVIRLSGLFHVLMP